MKFYFVPNRTFILFFTLLVLSLALVLPVFAQDATPEPAPTNSVIPSDALTPDQAIELGNNTFQSAIGAFLNAALTLTIVSALKLFLPPEWNFGTVKTVVATLLTVGWLAAVKFNFSETFTSVAQFVSVALPAAVTLYGGLKGAPAVHEAASKVGVPFFGYDATPES